MRQVSGDDICALATPPAGSFVALIRLSGQTVIGKVRSIFSAQPVVVDGMILPFLYVNEFRAPRSYTGEDVAEIITHGNPAIVDAVLAVLARNRIRRAERGEFTMRAFVNGKMTLSQAESVLALVNSTSDDEIEKILATYKGELSRRIVAVREETMELLARVEADLDFTDQDMSIVSYEEISKRAREILREIEQVIGACTVSLSAAGTVRVALIGEPNNGKSTLLNRLAGFERSIVSNIEGTTRDPVSVKIRHKGIEFEVVDCAGVCVAEGILEEAAQARTMEEIMKCDIVVRLLDAARNGQDANSPATGSKARLIVTNKIDVSPQKRGIGISAKTGAGIDEFMAELDRLAAGAGDDRGLYSVTSRQMRHLQGATVPLQTLLEGGITKDIAAHLLKAAYGELVNLDSAAIGDVVLTEIFSKFCIGK